METRLVFLHHHRACLVGTFPLSLHGRAVGKREARRQAGRSLDSLMGGWICIVLHTFFLEFGVVWVLG